MKKSGITRKTLLRRASDARGRQLQRRKKLAARNVVRHAAEVLRANGPVERRQWIKTLPSVVSGLGPCEAAHTRTGGTSRKADACWTVPLMADEHRELHCIGIRSFEAKYGVSLDALAIQTEEKWQTVAR